jgi:membrane protease YdiL (CAAX protease family)
VIKEKAGDMTKQQFIWISPVVVVVISTMTIRIAAGFMGVWAWLPWILVYWAIIGGLALWGGGMESVRRWMRPAEGNWLWSALAVLLGLAGLTMFVSSWRLITPLHIFIPWLILGLANPFFEEWYWRGLMLDHTQNWINWIRVCYVSLFFSLNHLFGIGVTSIGARNPIFLVNTFVLSVLFSVIYLKTKSLRWLVLGHALADLLGLSVPVFLNLWVPPG